EGGGGGGGRVGVGGGGAGGRGRGRARRAATTRALAAAAAANQASTTRRVRRLTGGSRRRPDARAAARSTPRVPARGSSGWRLREPRTGRGRRRGLRSPPPPHVRGRGRRCSRRTSSAS